MRALAAAVVVLVALPTFPSRDADAVRRDAPPPVHSQAGSVAGRWRGRGNELSLVLALTQSGDSVGGDGTFTAVPGVVGCGGETLPDSGRVTLAGRVLGAALQARMRFTGGWGPPFLATLAGTDTLRGRFMGVDRPGCALTLVRVR